MAQASEVAILPLKPGIDIETGDLKTALHEAFQTISEASGYQNLFYGRQVEHPDILQLSLDWDSVDSFKAFVASPASGPFKERLGLILGGPPNLNFISRPSASPFSGAVSAPVTEMISLYFPSSYVDADFDKSFALFKEKAATEGVKSIVGGWSVVQLPPKPDGEEAEEGKEKLFVAAIGWESIDAHMKFRETQGFKEAMPYLRVAKSIEMHHVKFTQF